MSWCTLTTSKHLDIDITTSASTTQQVRKFSAHIISGGLIIWSEKRGALKNYFHAEKNEPDKKSLDFTKKSVRIFCIRNKKWTNFP